MLQLGSPTGLYGAERWILALVKHLPAQKIRSVVGVVKDDRRQSSSELCIRASDLGFEVREFTAPGRLSLSAVGQLRQFILDNEIDILHTHWYKADLIGLLAVRGTGCRIVTTPHGWSTDAGFALQVYEILDRLSFAFMDAVVPLSPELHLELTKWPFVRRRVRLINNGVDLEEVDSVISAVADDSGNKEDETFHIGYIGQIIPRKGVDTLIRALSNLPGPQFKLTIVGDGPQRHELEELSASLGCRDRVCFAGFREDRLEMLMRFDVFVLPSLLEGIPRCLLEAMAAGVPVVATDIPGCADIVESGVSGVLFQPGDVPALSDVLSELSLDPERRKELAANAAVNVRENFSASRMAGEYLQLFSSLLSQRKSQATRTEEAE